MTTPNTDLDPLADAESTPAVSWKNMPIGTSYTGTVVDPPQQVQSRDFDTGELRTWDNGDPIWDVVTKLDIDGEVKGLWASKWKKEGSLYSALAKAQKALGRRIQAGDVLTVTFVGEEPNERNPKLNPRKLYTVELKPGAPGSGSDPLAGGDTATSDKPPF